MLGKDLYEESISNRDKFNSKGNGQKRRQAKWGLRRSIVIMQVNTLMGDRSKKTSPGNGERSITSAETIFNTIQCVYYFLFCNLVATDYLTPVHTNS